MKYYIREVTKREKINKYGKIGYVLYNEMVKTNNIDKFNKGKQIKFEEDNKQARDYLYHRAIDTVYTLPIVK